MCSTNQNTKVRFLVRSAPKYLQVSVIVTLLPLHWTLKWTFCFNIFSIVPSSRHSTLPFSRFISSLLLSNQSADSFKSFVSKLLTVEISFEATYMSVSSAYFKSLLYLIILATSLKKMMKSNETVKWSLWNFRSYWVWIWKALKWNLLENGNRHFYRLY